MKRRNFVLFFIIFLSCRVYCQDQSTCDFQWSPEQLAFTLPTANGSVFYHLQTSKCIGEDICGWPKIGMSHTLPAEANVAIRLKGVDCSGKVIEMEFGALHLKPNEIYKDKGNWHLFARVTEVISGSVDFMENGKRRQFKYKNGIVTEKGYEPSELQLTFGGVSNPYAYGTDAPSSIDDNIKEKKQGNTIRLPCTDVDCPPGFYCRNGFCTPKEKRPEAEVAKVDNSDIKIACHNNDCPPGYGCKNGVCVKGYVKIEGYESIKGRVVCQDGRPAANKAVKVSNEKYNYTFTTDEQGNYKGKIVSEPEMLYTLSVQDKTTSVDASYKSAEIGVPDLIIENSFEIPSFLKEPSYGFAVLQASNKYVSFTEETVYFTEVVEVTNLDCPNAKAAEKQATNLRDYTDWRYRGCLMEWAEGKFNSSKKIWCLCFNLNPYDSDDDGYSLQCFIGNISHACGFVENQGELIKIDYGSKSEIEKNRGLVIMKAQKRHIYCKVID